KFRQSLKGILLGRFPLMEVEEAGNGKEALERVDVLQPEIVFMDIKLPGESGLELTKKIKTDYPRLTVIVLTSYNLPEYRQAAYQCGASYFLTKDASPEELVQLVQLILSKRGSDTNAQGRD
ncbi:MAG: response regulator, partial [Proteobacteria bacterium]|nr:response regulator [Pseudomonadota bacterium]NIS68924.1 response regulator [Pseudomonadota bacterium]